MSRKQIDGNVDILQGSIQTAMLAALSVTTAKIALLAVGAAQLASDAVTTAKILANNVTRAKMANAAVPAQVLGTGTSGLVVLTAPVDAANTNLSAAQMVGGLIVTDAMTAGRTFTTTTAALLWAALGVNSTGIVPAVGTTFYMQVRNSGSGFTATLVMDASITGTGTLTVANNFTRTFLFTLTSATTATCQSIGTQAV